MKRNILNNFLYQSIFQITKIIIPFITIPIVSKSLGPTNLGIFNYTNSIVQYFVIFASLGIATYGNREIAIAKGKRQDISSIFWEIFTLKIFIGIIISILYILIIPFFQNKYYYLIQFLYVLGTIIDISWLFMGLEDFKKTSMTNLFIQILTLFSIVFFIKSEKDLSKYILIQSVGTVLSQGLVWLFLKEYVSFIKVNLKNVFGHFRGAVDFFVLQITIMLYSNMNKTIIGILFTSTYVAYYSNGMQLSNMVITIITTLDMVMLPHMSNLFTSKNGKNEIVKQMDKTVHLQLFFSILFMFGLLTIYDKFTVWFFGDKFLYLNNIIPLFSVLIVIIPLGISIARQYLTPIGEIKKFNHSVIVGAFVNMAFIIIFVPFLNFFGVVLAIIIAEFFVTFTRVKSFLAETTFKFNYKKISIFIISGLIMCVTTRYLTYSMEPTFFTTVFQVIMGGSIYMVITFIFKMNELWKLLPIEKLKK